MKIQSNSICPCGSGLRYKQCCGLGDPITSNSCSIISPDRPNANEFEKVVKEYTGHYPDDYIRPITVKAPIFHILIDESRIDKYYAISGIVISKDELDNMEHINVRLSKMAEDYYVDNFHFTDIFGRTRVLKDKTNAFIDEYSEVVCQLEMYPFSVCKSKEYVEEYQKIKGLTEEQIYISLQWQLMFKILRFMTWKFGNNFIIHMWREQENITTEKRLLHQDNIVGLLNIFPFANVSIYRHYEIFMKKELLSSSLSDLVAYFTTRIQSRNATNMSESKLLRDNYDIIKLISKVFKEYEFVEVDNLDKYIGEVLKREEYRNR